ncbi:hypothetical protein [Coleofasciculus chthonoplastes]|uniref:hypothetical protein n=1 Tax=Coleofasciculus chthonoplastes TaxID=64178 RepID=UPI0032FF68F9
MDTALVSPEAVALLSRITGQKLSQRQLTPPVIFLAALVTVLLGVMFADGTVTDEEKQQLQAILDNLTPSGSKLRKLAQLLLKGVKQHQVYTKLDQLTTLTIPLSEAEKLLVISFGYKMLANTRGINSRETSYLQFLTNQLGVNSKYLAVLEAGFSGQENINLEALQQFHSFLNPANFQSIDLLFVNAASYILTELPAIPPSLGNQAVNSYSLELQQSATKIKESLQVCLNELDQAETVWNTKPKIAKLAKQEILEKLGECSGLYVKICNLDDKLKNQTIEQAKISWQEWLDKLKEDLKEEWFSDVSLEEQKVEDKNKLARYYAKEFSQDLMAEVDNWFNDLIKLNIQCIDQDLEIILEHLILFNQEITPDCGTHIINEIEEIKKNLYSTTEELHDYFGGNESESDLLGWIVDGTGFIVGSVTSGIAGVFKFGGRGNDAPQPSIKQKIFEKGWERLEQSQDEILNKIKEILVLVIDKKIQSATDIAEQAVSFYEEFLQRQDRYQEETEQQRNAEKAWISQQRQELEKVQKNIEVVLSMPSS